MVAEHQRENLSERVTVVENHVDQLLQSFTRFGQKFDEFLSADQTFKSGLVSWQGEIKQAVATSGRFDFTQLIYLGAAIVAMFAFAWAMLTGTWQQQIQGLTRSHEAHAQQGHLEDRIAMARLEEKLMAQADHDKQERRILYWRMKSESATKP